jgi:hypothetical protein
MPPEIETRLERARQASGEELKSLVEGAAEEVLLAALQNPKLEEAHVSTLLDRLDVSANVLSAVAGEAKWTSSEGVRLRLARHPRTPKRIALAVVRQLYLFDLVRVSLSPPAPTDIRRVAEEIILARVAHLPVGEKLTLARRGPSRVAGALIAEGHPQAVKLALDNAFLTESQVLKALASPGVPERAVAAIAQHRKWSCQYNVRMALIRNPLTPVSFVLAFLPHLSRRDLQDLFATQGLAPRLRKHIGRELARLGGEMRESEP